MCLLWHAGVMFVCRGASRAFCAAMGFLILKNGKEGNERKTAYGLFASNVGSLFSVVRGSVQTVPPMGHL